MLDNDLEGNDAAATRFDATPGEGRWERNHGLTDDSVRVARRATSAPRHR